MIKTAKHPTGRPSSGTIAQRRPDLVPQLVNTDDAYLSYGSKKTVKWRCPTDPSHLWDAPVCNRTRTSKPSGCPFCSGRRPVPGVNDLATTHPQLAAQLVHPEQAKLLKAASNRKVVWRCLVHPEHTWQAVVSQRTREHTGCPYCSGRRRLSAVNDLATTHPHLAAQLVDTSLAITLSAGSHTRVRWRCHQNAAHTWTATPKDRVYKNTGCPTCANTGTSSMEQAFAHVIIDLLPDHRVLTNNTTVCPPYELDVVIPDLRTVIEFNGLFWHSEQMGRSHTYHRDKNRALSAIGYRLIHVWEDDWTHNRDVLIRTLAYKLHALDQLDHLVTQGIIKRDRLAASRTPARTLLCAEVAPGAVYEFLDRHHLQGRTPLTRAFVLRNRSGMIHAVLGLRSPRHNSRMNRAPGVWEIQRYATRGIVSGGFTKLLAHAERVLLAEGVELTEWLTMSANDISDGGMYKRAGFTVHHEVRPNYSYAGNRTGWRRMSKESFQKKRFKTDPHLIYDPKLTEARLAALNHLVRIWDAGKTCWTKPVLPAS